MLHATIHLEFRRELSPATARRTEASAWSRMRGLFGAAAREVGGDTLATWTVLSQVGSAFERVGVRDVIRVEIDGAQTYVDVEGHDEDLGDALRRTATHPHAQGALRRLHVVFAREDAGLHTLFDLAVATTVAGRGPALRIDATARPTALRPRRGESAAEYVARVRAAALAGTFLDALRSGGLEQIEALAVALGQHMPGVEVRREPARVALVAPDRAAMERFALLTWGPSVEPPRYLPSPVLASGDPFERHHRDPYWPLTQWALLRAMFDDGALRQPGIDVRDVAGHVLFAADHVDAFDRRALEADLHRVALDPQGHLVLR